jgi:hypothetical protein
MTQEATLRSIKLIKEFSRCRFISGCEKNRPNLFRIGLKSKGGKNLPLLTGLETVFVMPD